MRKVVIMLPYRDSRLTIIVLAVFFCIALGYALFEARGMVFGPVITVPAQVSEVHEPYILIQGQAARISSLSMNGKSITVSEKGQFSQPYLLAPGYNRIILDAKDQYGRSTERVIEVMYVPAASSLPPINTSATDSTSSPQASMSTSASSSTPAMAPQTQ